MALPLIGWAFRIGSGLGRASSVAFRAARILGQFGFRAARVADRLDLFDARGHVQISVQHNFPEVMRKLEELHRDIATKALVSAVNKTVAQGKTYMSREIRNEFNLPANKVNAALHITRAQYRYGMFTVQASLESPSKRGRSLNLINFGARQTSKGVSFKVRHGGGRQVIPGAFIGNGGRTVFIRTGKPRLPIKALQTIDVPQMFNTRRINAKVVKVMSDRFPEIFAHEASYYINRFNRPNG